jgi:hypothetical protein|tara:strand:+ start:1382 stop:2257 length:876 start_codon:yes stop_codon:yes gene_type:complete
MRLMEVTQQRIDTINESGSMSGVGAIHISEIEPTLDYLEKSLGMDLKNNVLGSVGKKEFSGDIDVAIDVEPEAMPELLDKLKINPDIIDIAKSSVIMTKVKIAKFDANKTCDRARTGYVQLDFMPGNPGWMKTYYHSPADGESEYKGVFRNILLAVICALYDRKDSAEQTEDGRSLQSEQYLFSPTKGLVRVRRNPVPKKNGEGYTKQNNNVIIDGPWLTPDEIVKVLGLDKKEDLNSYESLKSAIEQNYPAELTAKILDSFANNKQIKDIGVPSDLQIQEDVLMYMRKLS